MSVLIYLKNNRDNVMNPKDRRSEILQIISINRQVSVEMLADEFNASAETIRRDLSLLVKKGKVQRIHGGAQLPRLDVEAPFKHRLNEFTYDKRAVARKAASLISPGDSFFIDTGSTTIFLAEAIKDIEELTVVTNSCDVAKIIQAGLGRSRVFLLGGEFSKANNQTVGSLAIAQISQFTTKFVFLTAGGVDSIKGITDFSFEEAQIAQAMINQADERVVIVDKSKLNRAVTHKVCQLRELTTLVTNDFEHSALIKSLQKNFVNLVMTGDDGDE